VAAVVEICHHLDGMPPALVAALTPAEIAGRLDQRFRLLAGGRRTAVERHQTLRASVDWSYGCWRRASGWSSSAWPVLGRLHPGRGHRPGHR
jgi:predicted ATPase